MVKRMFILAKCKPEFAPLASSVHSMFFLATPHNGADLAQTLARLLSLGLGGTRPFLSDLSGQSALIQSLNEDFPRYSQDLRLFSFFETLPSDLSWKKRIIVDRASAVLGYPNERVDHLHASHRDVCKYTSKNDPNYRSVRNALASTLRELQLQFSSMQRKLGKDQQRLLEAFLGPQDNHEDDFMAIDEQRVKGSCEWLVRKESFQDWLKSNDSSFYCLAGQPGTGKTILSGKVIAHVKSIEGRCSFYFFHDQNKGVSDITNFILSLARQMASQDQEVLKICLAVYDADESLSQRNHRTIWRKLFLEGILSSNLGRSHYWVVDALDECHEETELVKMLLRAAECRHLRIFSTTRNPYNSVRPLKTSGVRIFAEEILEQDSRSDIALFLKASIEELPGLTERGQKQIVNEILEKSQGCFLWTSLAFQELRKIHISADAKRVLDEVPTGMNDLYAKILERMSVTAYEKPLAKAIITWTVCSARNLTALELKDALSLDLPDSVHDIVLSIQSSCGHLIYVDAQSAVKMVHLTARQYLLDPQTPSEFAVNEKQGHRLLLMSCLRYLQGDERKAARLGRSNKNYIRKPQSPLMRYASEYLHEHLRHLSWTDTGLVTALARLFASSNILSWIEYIAAQSDLSRLIDTGEALGVFLEGTSKADLAEAADLAMLDSWSTDLVRFVMQFGSNLKAYPASVFNLIAPFCPLATAPRRQFGSIPRGITVRGLQGADWGDCLSTISDPHQRYSTITSSEKNFAIGCISGKIMVFRHLLYHKTAEFDHLEPVRLLCFGYQQDILASAGSAVIRIWNITSKSELHRFDTQKQCLALTFADQGRQIIAALKDHQLKTWNLVENTLEASTNWTVGLEATALELYRRPITAAISVDTQLLAVIYKGQDILIWDIEGDCLYDVYNRDSGATGLAGRPYGSAGVRCLEFGVGESTDLLAAGYTDGELILFDMSSGEVKQSDAAAFAHLLSRSPDGLKLATADPSGTIQIFQFENLKLLYRINSVDPGIQGLAFSGDGQQLLDVRGSCSRIWGPTVLVRNNHVLGCTVGKPQETSLKPAKDSIVITSIALHDSRVLFFCGKENGVVYMCDIDTGLSIKPLFSHANGVEIISLKYDPSSSTITSVDTSSRVLIHRLSSRDKAMTASDVLFDHRAELAMGQVVSRPDLSRILLCSPESGDLWSITNDGSQIIAKIPYSQTGSYYWANHPLHSDQLLLATRDVLHIYDWQSLKQLTPPSGIRLDSHIPSDLSPHYMRPIFNNSVLAIMYGEIGRPLSKTKLMLYDTSELRPNAATLLAASIYKYLCSKVTHILGTVGRGVKERLVFLQDANWVFTVDAENAKESRLSAHFFFPVDWLSITDHLGLMAEVTEWGDVLMVRKDEVAIIRRSLTRVEYEEKLVS